MKETGERVSSLGEAEVGEGAARLEISEDMAARSDELAQAGVDLTAQGLAQLSAASGMREAARNLVTEGAASFGEAAGKIGVSEALAADEAENKEE